MQRFDLSADTDSLHNAALSYNGGLWQRTRDAVSHR